MKRRNTKQMNVILDIMKNDRSHPTIQELCEKVATVDSSIGQATVYRNVSKLCEEGILTKISVGIDHYDYIFCRNHIFSLNQTEKAYIYLLLLRRI